MSYELRVVSCEAECITEYQIYYINVDVRDRERNALRNDLNVVIRTSHENRNSQRQTAQNVQSSKRL